MHESRSGQGSHQRRGIRPRTGHGHSPGRGRRAGRACSTFRTMQAARSPQRSDPRRAITAPMSPANPRSTPPSRRRPQRMGGLNVAVSCAGVATPGKLLGKDGPLPVAAFQRVIDINVLGTFLLDRAAAAIMQGNSPDADGERGLLVHTASVAAFEGQIGQVAYGTSKAAVAGMVLPLARELARFGIRVVGIAPGIFGTPMMAGLPQEAQDSLGKQVPVPAATRPAGRVRGTGRRNRHQPHVERRHDPARWRDPHGASLVMARMARRWPAGLPSWRLLAVSRQPPGRGRTPAQPRRAAAYATGERDRHTRSTTTSSTTVSRSCCRATRRRRP